MGAQCGQGRLEQGRCGPRPVSRLEQGRWNGVWLGRAGVACDPDVTGGLHDIGAGFCYDCYERAILRMAPFQLLEKSLGILSMSIGTLSPTLFSYR